MRDALDIKKDFSIFERHPTLAYLDTASTAQTPRAVIDAVRAFDEQSRANIHRGVYALSAEATGLYESARKTVADFIGADANEIVFTSGTTMGLNMLAQTLAIDLGPGDNIVLTRMEHHANLVPWQEMAKRFGFEIRFIEMTSDFGLRTSAMPIDETTKIVSVAHVSNALGTMLPVKEIFARAKEIDAITILDAAQSVAHMPIDVKELDCDFLVFSGQKMYGPTGIGVLYGKSQRLNALEPFFFGGDMVREVTYERATWMEAPQKFEAGTPNISGAIGLAAAAQYLQSIGWDAIEKHERELTSYAIEQLEQLEQVKIIGPKANRIGVISFVMDGVHSHDIATILDKRNIAVRAGHHCAMPLMHHLDISGTTRLSLGVYNKNDDIDRLIAGLKDAQKLFL